METKDRVMWILMRRGIVIATIGLLVLGLIAGSASAGDNYFFGKKLD
ncbi:MAG TPA: hypothetical protein VI893_00185 [Thermoplasmata archaeon]|nr:hypothetical protein [Thermoplasmata archaeon]